MSLTYFVAFFANISLIYSHVISSNNSLIRNLDIKWLPILQVELTMGISEVLPNFFLNFVSCSICEQFSCPTILALFLFSFIFYNSMFQCNQSLFLIFEFFGKL